ncbi:hypothetical protein [Streptomyces niveus]|uniref:hypothetical protein n=1 Tax=Streptomyces niveus TaxID=193462 RepID=UPI00342E498E
MADTADTSVELDEETAELARQNAARGNTGLPEYISGLVRDDEKQRTVFLSGAREVLDNWGSAIDEALGEQAA